jgi:LmbE family N-acetylglucosaminyl deacetylase
MAERRKVLVIAPHPDDEAIGCGGALCDHATRGDRAAAVFLTSGELGLKHLPREEAWQVREREAEAAAAILGVAGLRFLRCPDWYLGDHVAGTAVLLRAVLERECPDTIYVPHGREWHPDHRAALPILRTALGGRKLPDTRVLTYEVWTPLTEYDHAVDVTEVMPRKLRAIRCHQSQLGSFRYDQAIHGLNRYRGIIAARCRYAEVFQSAPLSSEHEEP